MGTDIVRERVFGPEIPGKYKHPASITELANGDLYIVYYGGSEEYGGDSAVYGTRKRPGESSWSKPKLITPRPKWPEGNGVVWQAPDGIVWLFSVVRPGYFWSSSLVMVRTSRDGAETWEHPVALTSEPGTMVRAKPIVLADGDYLLPIYHETGHDQEWVAPDTCSLFLRHHGKQRDWTPSRRIYSRNGNLQPAVAALSADHLICYCRHGGDYKPRTDGYLVRSESHDGGKTWSSGRDSAFPNPHSAADFMKLANGHLLLVYNNSMTERSPLTVAISTDNDKTYPYKMNLAEGKDDFAYPFAIQSKDGLIHVVYTSEKRTVVNHVVFDERAVLGTKGK
jgi:predicted neuraminidase